MRWVFGLVFIALGFSILFDVNIFRFIIPVLLIWLGWNIISKEKSPENTETGNTVTEDMINETVVFSGTKKVVMSEAFKGGTITSVFGGIDIDLTKAKSKDKTIHLELNAILGGIRIRVPRTWEIEIRGVTKVFGGFDKRVNSDTKTSSKLILTGVAVLGGIDLSD